MAYGLPVEGDDGPFLGEHVSAVPTCDVSLTVADARRILRESGTDLVVVLAGDGFVVGEIDPGAVEGHGDDEGLIDVMAPTPSTVRPSVTMASVAAAGGGRRLVTTSDGRLVGAVTVDADEHGHGTDGHEGHDHDHGDGDVDMERFERELTQVMEGVQERFGDREPTEKELRAFLHERLVREGRSPEEADRFLDELAE
jgi:hypothetical protein